MVFVDRYLERHITPVTLKSNIKRNPLYMDMRSVDTVDNEKSKPSWTVKDYDTQAIHGNLTNYLKVIKGGEERLTGWMGVWGAETTKKDMRTFLQIWHKDPLGLMYKLEYESAQICMQSTTGTKPQCSNSS